MRDWLMLFVAVGLGMMVVLVAMTVKPEAFIAYKAGFEAGIQYEKNMRKQQHDSIVANCIYNNGVPTKIRDGYEDKSK